MHSSSAARRSAHTKIPWMEKLAASGSVSADALEVAAASAAFFGLVAECVGKSSPSHRAGLDAAAIQMTTDMVAVS